MNSYIIAGLIIYVLSYAFYVRFSHGLGHKAEYLQLRRFFPCAVLAVLPMYLMQQPLTLPIYLLSGIVGISWIVTYPLLYYWTYKKNSSDFGFHLDTVFGLYITGWLISLKLFIMYFNILPAIFMSTVSVIEFLLFLIPLFQIIYYLIYKTCINDSAIALIRETDNNETIEFYRSLPLTVQIVSPLLVIAAFISIISINTGSHPIKPVQIQYLAVMAAELIFLTIYLWNTRKGVFIRTGIVELYLDVLNYIRETNQYKEKLHERLATLSVIPSAPAFDKPSTIIMVIGESESRDYMSVYTGDDKNSTPWMQKLSENRNCILFKNAYSCKNQTVACLERALTEANQYNDKKFYESCSIIDIARKAGYKTYWFSNQGHIGSAETAITLVANTADKAAWTKQNLNQFQYDETLLEYLKTVNPKENNFIILHLMGSHFNFINRYPQDKAYFSKPNKYDLIPNYLDSIRYTDYVLQQFKEYAEQNLNLQAFVYFSDHATIPDKRRSPNFGGFGTVRIPMCVYLSDEYISKHQSVYTAMQDNRNRYFTNDLMYEFMCGLLDITSEHYDEENSLASVKYKYTVDDLKTELGTLSIKEDIKK